MRKTYRRYLSILPFLILLMSCADSSNRKDNPTPTTNNPAIVHANATQVAKENGVDAEQRKEFELCETERIWAYQSGQIDAEALAIYRKRNMAPVYHRAGERQSGIEGWYACDKALKLNRFSKERDINPRIDSTKNTVPDKKTPTPKATSEVPKESPKEAEDARNRRLCEEERVWNLKHGAIDEGAFRIYSKRNFAPIYESPGERESGIEGWYPCAQALIANGFIEGNLPHSEFE